MPTVTRTILQNRIRDITGFKSGSAHLLDDELNYYINSAIYGLLDLVSKTDGDHYLSGTNITMDGADTVSLPSDCYQVKGVDYQLTNSSWTTLHPFTFNDRNVYKDLSFASSAHESFRYRVYSNNIQFIPTPSSGSTMKVWHIPVPAGLTGSSDTLNIWNGWDDYVVLDASIKVMGLKQKSFDTTNARIERDRIEKRILEGSARRMNEPEYVGAYFLNDLGF